MEGVGSCVSLHVCVCVWGGGMEGCYIAQCVHCLLKHSCLERELITVFFPKAVLFNDRAFLPFTAQGVCREKLNTGKKECSTASPCGCWIIERPVGPTHPTGEAAGEAAKGYQPLNTIREIQLLISSESYHQRDRICITELLVHTCAPSEIPLLVSLPMKPSMCECVSLVLYSELHEV